MVVWDAEALMVMASGACGPALPNYWRALALYNVCAEYTAYFTKVGRQAGTQYNCLYMFQFVNISYDMR